VRPWSGMSGDGLIEDALDGAVQLHEEGVVGGVAREARRASASGYRRATSSSRQIVGKRIGWRSRRAQSSIRMRGRRARKRVESRAETRVPEQPAGIPPRARRSLLQSILTAPGGVLIFCLGVDYELIVIAWRPILPLGPAGYHIRRRTEPVLVVMLFVEEAALEQRDALRDHEILEFRTDLLTGRRTCACASSQP